VSGGGTHTHKAEGFDGISAELVKDKSDAFISRLTAVINESWNEGTFPKAWSKRKEVNMI
jgi:hypothetical protein